MRRADITNLEELRVGDHYETRDGERDVVSYLIRGRAGRVVGVEGERERGKLVELDRIADAWRWERAR